jgi:hypothetical protein
MVDVRYWRRILANVALWVPLSALAQSGTITPNYYGTKEFSKLEALDAELRAKSKSTLEGRLNAHHSVSFVWIKHCEPDVRGKRAEDVVARCNAEHRPLLDEWQRQFPSSPFPVIGRATLLEYAARLHARDVDKSAQLHQSAWDELTRIPPGQRPVLWYELAFEIAMGAGWPENRYWSLVGEGFRDLPVSVVADWAVQYALPRNGGSLSMIAKLASEGLEYHDHLGISMYVHVMHAARSRGVNVYFKGVADWKIMQAGLRKWALAEPHKPVLWLDVANHACDASDYQALDLALPRSKLGPESLAKHCRIGLDNWRQMRKQQDAGTPAT